MKISNPDFITLQYLHSSFQAINLQSNAEVTRSKCGTRLSIMYEGINVNIQNLDAF